MRDLVALFIIGVTVVWAVTANSQGPKAVGAKKSTATKTNVKKANPPKAAKKAVKKVATAKKAVKKVVKKAPAKKPTYKYPWSPRKDCTGTYGNKSKKKATKVSLDELIKNHQKYKNTYLSVTAKVGAVCPKKGCWMMLSDGKHLMRVRFKNYAFFMPTNSTGYYATVEGYGRMITVSVALARHYALDRGDKAAAAKITKPQKGVAFMADWVSMAKTLPKKKAVKKATKKVAKKVAKVVKKPVYKYPWSPRKDCTGTYGNKSKKKATKVTLSELIKNHQKYKNTYLSVTAKVGAVCPKKGCWMMLTDGKYLMRVRFKNYAFFMPTNSTGYTATVEGYGRMITVSVALARHYALDRGDKAAAAKITKPQKGVAFMADWVNMAKSK